MFSQRNQRWRLTNPRPKPRFDDDVHTGNPAQDGYTRLAQADPHREGARPTVAGTEGPVFHGPDSSFD